MRCLIVDDEELNRDIVGALLKDAAEYDEAACGNEAIDKFSAALQNGARYDLVLLDILMPEMSGHEAAKAMREIEKKEGITGNDKAHIVMLTSLNSAQDAMESFSAAQSSAYIVKPVSKEKLFNVISKLGLLKK